MERLQNIFDVVQSYGNDCLGAAAGFWFGDTLTHSVLVLVEGFAAGAMLTMIAAAMIPEAIHLGGRNATGLATLIGFLSTVGFKLLE